MKPCPVCGITEAFGKCPREECPAKLAPPPRDLSETSCLSPEFREHLEKMYAEAKVKWMEKS